MRSHSTTDRADWQRLLAGQAPVTYKCERSCCRTRRPARPTR